MVVCGLKIVLLINILNKMSGQSFFKKIIVSYICERIGGSIE
jgi:hypothetical protein